MRTKIRIFTPWGGCTSDGNFNADGPILFFGKNTAVIVYKNMGFLGCGDIGLKVCEMGYVLFIG